MVFDRPKANGGSLWQLESGDKRLQLIRQQLDSFNRDISRKARRNKFARMTCEPFAFFRGTAHLYYHDLYHQKVLSRSEFSTPETATWLQGDLHVENYGAFCDGKGDVIYDLDDFDESWIDCYLYDLYRLAASLLLVVERQDPEGLWGRQELLRELSAAYLERLEQLNKDPSLKQVKITELEAHGKLKKFILKAKEANSRRKMLDKWTVQQEGLRFFDLEHHKLEAVDGDTRFDIKTQIESYHHQLQSELKGKQDYFSVLDVARRQHAGTGSHGTPRYYVLIDADSTHAHDYRILDVKRQVLPSHYPYLSDVSLTRMRRLYPEESQGCRVAAAQCAMHVHADDHLGSINVHGHSYSVRERSPYKKTLNTAKLVKYKHVKALAQQWGMIAANAHARADRSFDERLKGRTFEAVVGRLCKNRREAFNTELFDFADSYARQVKLDHELFLQALDREILS